MKNSLELKKNKTGLDEDLFNNFIFRLDTKMDFFLLRKSEDKSQVFIFGDYLASPKSFYNVISPKFKQVIKLDVDFEEKILKFINFVQNENSMEDKLTEFLREEFGNYNTFEFKKLVNKVKLYEKDLTDFVKNLNLKEMVEDKENESESFELNQLVFKDFYDEKIKEEIFLKNKIQSLNYNFLLQNEDKEINDDTFAREAAKQFYFLTGSGEIKDDFIKIPSEYIDQKMTFESLKGMRSNSVLSTFKYSLARSKLLHMNFQSIDSLNKIQHQIDHLSNDKKEDTKQDFYRFNYEKNQVELFKIKTILNQDQKEKIKGFFMSFALNDKDKDEFPTSKNLEKILTKIKESPCRKMFLKFLKKNEAEKIITKKKTFKNNLEYTILGFLQQLEKGFSFLIHKVARYFAGCNQKLKMFEYMEKFYSLNFLKVFGNKNSHGIFMLYQNYKDTLIGNMESTEFLGDVDVASMFSHFLTTSIQREIKKKTSAQVFSDFFEFKKELSQSVIDGISLFFKSYKLFTNYIVNEFDFAGKTDIAFITIHYLDMMLADQFRHIFLYPLEIFDNVKKQFDEFFTTYSTLLENVYDDFKIIKDQKLNKSNMDFLLFYFGLSKSGLSEKILKKDQVLANVFLVSKSWNDQPFYDSMAKTFPSPEIRYDNNTSYSISEFLNSFYTSEKNLKNLDVEFDNEKIGKDYIDRSRMDHLIIAGILNYAEYKQNYSVFKEDFKSFEMKNIYKKFKKEFYLNKISYSDLVDKSNKMLMLEYFLFNSAESNSFFFH